MSKPHIMILGAGPAGVGAAYRLRSLDRADVTIVEQRDVVGGNAGSFEMGGQRLDYGSHRLHPATDLNILADIKNLLGGDLVDRPRHGRINLRGKWIHFPLKPLDMLLHMDRGFALRTTWDMVAGLVKRTQTEGDTFASVLRANLGPTICDSFYFPYARKIWGREPEELSAIQARRRVSAGSFGKLLRKVAAQLPGLKKDGKGRFFYPRHGYGQISEAFADAARDDGAAFLLGWKVEKLVEPGTLNRKWKVIAERDGEQQTFEPDYVWSTIPVSLLARMVEPPPPAAVLKAAASLRYRAMLLIYLQLPVDRFTEYDAHYFPGAKISITRLSEPKNYAGSMHPRAQTTLCAELPCSIDDEYWSMTDTELGRIVADDLALAKIPLPRPPSAIHVKRLHHAYPIYEQGYEQYFDVLDAWVGGLPRLLSYGRQGLFAHDNTHHALAMAYAAVDCLADGAFDTDKWDTYRSIFEAHVVED